MDFRLAVEHFVDQTATFFTPALLDWLCKASTPSHVQIITPGSRNRKCSGHTRLCPLTLRLTLRGEAFENKITIITYTTILMGKRSC